MRVSLPIVVLLGVFAAIAPASGKEPARKPGAWTLTITTSGGFVGNGKGSLQIESAGHVTRPCERHAADAELMAVRDAVEDARPVKWRSSYHGHDHMSDQFSYALSLVVVRDDGTEVEHHTRWRDSSIGDLPPDLKRLYDAAWPIHESERCKR